MSHLSNQEVLKLAKSLRHGADRQREAIAEARARGIFNAQAHLANSPIGQAFFQ